MSDIVLTIRSLGKGAGRLLWIVVVGILAAGCSGDKGDINLVQPGYVTKARLTEGSWYYRRTVVDKSEGLGSYLAIGTGDLFTMERIRFEIQEKWLIAYRDYEFVTHSDGGTEVGANYYGTALAAFPITEHFDIVRVYDSATSEETNVVGPNILDRPWFDREFMRVDWSKNGNPNIDVILPVDLVDVDGTGGGTFYVYEDDAVNPWRARVQPEQGYIDFVVNHFVEPDLDACLDAFEMAYECGSGEIKVRHAFWRVDQAQEASYLPLYYPDSVTLKDQDGKEIRDDKTGEVVREEVFGRFGYYRLSRLTYDDQRGLTESGRNRRIFRFNIWEESVDANGDEIPMAARTVRPIVYYLNWDFPQDLRAAAGEVATAWNQAFKATVASLQGKDVADIADVFVLEDNSCTVANLKAHFAANGPVRDLVAGDMAMAVTDENLTQHLQNFCAATEYNSQSATRPFTWQQIGDPRHNMMVWVPNITATGFSGYGPMLADPISGRIIVASAYVQGWTIEAATTRLLEYVAYINGELSFDEVIAGSNLPYAAEFAGLPTQSASSMTLGFEQFAERAGRLPSPEHLASLQARLAALGDKPGELLTPLENSRHFAERLSRTAGTALESDWALAPEDYIIAGKGAWDPSMALGDDLRQQASLVNRIMKVPERASKLQQFLGERTFCPMADLDDTLVGLAKELKSLEPPERRPRLRQEIFKAVMLHEVGHNIGLRHNFEGSWDALNFHDRFWELEASKKATEVKLDARQPEYMYSSIMDYHGRINADFQGLGKYDKAAVKFGYGQLVETFGDAAVVGGQELKNWRFDNDYKRLLVANGDDKAYFASQEQMTGRVDVRFDWNKDGLKAAEVAGLLRNEVPYGFCSDEYADRIPTCRRFDFGANAREQAGADYVNYKNYFIFTHFLRGRLTLDWNRAQRPAIRAFSNARQTYQYWYLYYSTIDDFLSTDRGKDMLEAFVQGFNLMAEVLAMPEPGPYVSCQERNGGREYYYPAGGVGTTVDGAETPAGDPCAIDEESKDPLVGLRLPMGWDSEPLFLGFSSDYVTWGFTYLGSYFDKQFAMVALTDPAATFFRVNDSEDLRTYSVSPYRVFDREILGLLGPLIEYDRIGVGSFVDPADLDANGFPQKGLSARKLLDSSKALADIRGEPPPATFGTAGLRPVYPALSRYLQRQAMIYGAAFLTSPLDASLDFATHLRVTLKGSYDDFSGLDDGSGKIAECTIPLSGQTYRARKVNDDDRYSIAHRMVTRCKDIVEALGAATGNDKDDLQDDLNVVQQFLQYARLVHLVFEHGDEL